MPDHGSVRRGQLISTYGVGAIVPSSDGSFMIAGLDRWSVSRDNEIHLHELALELGVNRLYAPPSGDDQRVPVVRFPSWASCPRCHRLAEHSYFSPLHSNKCRQCDEGLIPSRFIVACISGHIDDFPYYAWVHQGRNVTRSGHELSIKSVGTTSTLRGVEIVCSCGESRNMYGSTGERALAPLGKCSGNRPWLSDHEDCDLIPRTLQRGASNVYFPVSRSAISIPPWSEGAYKAIQTQWRGIEASARASNGDEEALYNYIKELGVAEDSGFSVDDLLQVVLQLLSRKEVSQNPGPTEKTTEIESRLRSDEYKALIQGRSENSSEQDFVCIPANDPGRYSAETFENIMMVKRLRVVKALTSFSRIKGFQAGTPEEYLSPLFAEKTDWLPAIEVVGEGVFFEFIRADVEAWEKNPAVVSRIAKLDNRYRQLIEQNAALVVSGESITPRKVLLHSFAHILIDAWSLESGYPASALTERLYVSDEMLGVLIYTATSDSQGSLGGLVSQAERERLDGSLKRALVRAAWCSSDPMCIETDSSGVGSLNLVACHSCMLLPEVSCELSNVFLDRALLLGIPSDPSIGFFKSPLEDAR